MSLPTITVQVSFETNPMSAPVWVDISAYVREFHIKRGRQQQFDKPEAGTATLILKNSDRRFDPTYSAGPYYGNIWPMRKVQIRATYNSITYDLFTGFVETWLPDWAQMGKEEIVNIEAVDGFKWLALAKINTTYSEERSDVRVNNVLDSCNWSNGGNWILNDASNSQLDSTTILAPNGDRSVDGGQTTVQGQTLSDVFALQHLQDVVEAENGDMFVDGSGAFIFRNRYRQFQWPYNTSQATFGDSGTEYGYTELTGAFNDDLIYNGVRITVLGGSEQAASDATSQTKYGHRDLVRTSQLMTTDAEALYAAQYLLARYKELTDGLTSAPMLQFTEMKVRPQADDNMWPAVLGREMGDCILVKRTPSVGSVIPQQSNIIGLKHDYTYEKVWESTFHLMPADTKRYWILDDSALSALDNTTRLMY